MATRTDIRNRVLKKLRVLAAGESADADDAAVVDAAVAEKHEQLINRGLVAWDVDSVPPYAVGPFVTIVAAECCDEFGVPEGRTVRLVAQGQLAEQELAKQVAGPRADEPVTGTFF